AIERLQQGESLNVQDVKTNLFWEFGKFTSRDGESRNKTEDTTPRYNNDNQSGQFGNQRTMTVAGARETIGSPVVHVETNKISLDRCSSGCLDLYLG
ncbi:hypothetical protein Tco_1477666, partial [Tanacetum coccineum]